MTIADAENAMDEMEALRAELEHYRTEKEKIRQVIGQIGGASGKGQDRLVNVIFLGVVLGAFLFDVLRHIFGWHVPYLPPVLLLEVAVLLVSLKIIWMIHRQSRADHFQFWILNSIEFQLNTLSRRLADMEASLNKPRGGSSPPAKP